MAGTLLEAVARARDKRRRADKAYQAADEAFLQSLVQARRAHTWDAIADAAGLTRHGVRYRVNALPTTREGRKHGTD